MIVGTFPTAFIFIFAALVTCILSKGSARNGRMANLESSYRHIQPS